jgi:hypothetical protein
MVVAVAMLRDTWCRVWPAVFAKLQEIRHVARAAASADLRANHIHRGGSAAVAQT